MFVVLFRAGNENVTPVQQKSMAEISDLDALLADLQQASAELEQEIKQKPTNTVANGPSFTK